MLFVVLLFSLAIVLSANLKTRFGIELRLSLIALTATVALALSALIACGTSSATTGSGTSSNNGGATGSGGSGTGGTTTTASSISQLTTAASSVAAGSSMTAMVTLNAAAPAGGAQVSLTSSNGSAASVPANIVVASGQTSGNFTVITGNVSSDTSVSITAAYNNTSAAISLSVKAPVTPPPAPITISISPASASVQSQASQQFTAAVTGSTNNAVSWTAGSGIITGTGLFTAPNVSVTTTVNVFATLQADPSVVKMAQVTVTPLPAPPPSGGMYSGTGPAASWEAYQYLDTDGIYHQAILIFNSKGGYPVIGYSYYSPGCVDLGDTANDTWGLMGNGIWWFINKPQLVYVQWIWYNNATDKQIVQQTPCIDYSGAPKYN